MGRSGIGGKADPSGRETSHSFLAWATLSTYFVVTGLASGLYQASGVEPSSRFEVAYRLAYLMAITAWFTEYARQHRLALPMDMGIFLLAASFVLVPYFVLRAEGWRRGLGTLLMLATLTVSSLIIEWSVLAWSGASE